MLSVSLKNITQMVCWIGLNVMSQVMLNVSVTFDLDKKSLESIFVG